MWTHNASLCVKTGNGRITLRNETVSEKSQRLSAQENNMAESSAKERSRPWTETELKYFALVLADETNEYAYKLDTLALKKTANKPVFEDIKKAFEERISSEEFKEENDREHRQSKSKKALTHLRIDVEKLRVKFKWIKDQWRKYTDRIKKGSGKSPIEEPEWYKIINPIFSDTYGNLEIASKARDVLSHENSDTDSDEEQTETSHSSYQEDDGEEELTSASESGTEGVKRKVLKNSLDVKPLGRNKRVRSQSQAINEIAKSFHALGESQQKRCEKMMEADKERHAEFLAFQKEQAELNRQHELKMLQIIMKYSNPPPQGAQQHLQQQTMPVQPLVPYYNPMPYSHTPPTNQVASGSQDSHILDMDSQNDQRSMRWY